MKNIMFGSKLIDLSDWKSHDWRHQNTADIIAMIEVINRFEPIFPRYPTIKLPGYRPWHKPYFYLASVAVMRGMDRLELHRRLALVYKMAYPDAEMPSDVY